MPVAEPIIRAVWPDCRDSIRALARHLNESQRAMAAARIATMRQGSRTDLTEISVRSEVSQPKAAAMLSISPDSVQFARKVQTQAIPEMVAAVDAGIVPVSQAAKLADTPPETQARVLAKMASGEAKKVTDAVRRVRLRGGGGGGREWLPVECRHGIQ